MLALRRITRIVSLTFGLALAFVMASCGTYRVVGGGVDASNASTVAIVTLENDSLEPGLEAIVTRALRQDVLRRGTARLVSSPRGADLVIRGTVRPLITRSTSFSTVALAIEYTVQLRVEIEVTKADGTLVVIDRNAFRESELYLASADVEAARKNRHEALQRVAEVVAARVNDAVSLYLMDPAEPEDEGPT